MKNAGINIMIAFGESGGRPTIHADGCSASVDSVDVKHHGGTSWLYNLIVNQFEHKMKDMVQKAICDQAYKAVNEDAEKALAKSKLVASIRKTGVLDFSMLSDPFYANGYMESYHKGEIFWSGSHNKAPFHPNTFPESHKKSKMAYIWVSDYLMNTAGYVLQNQGILQYYLTPTDLKPKDRYYLYTTCPDNDCIGNFIVDLQEDFPNSEIHINMSTSIAPTLSIANGQMFGKFQGTMTYFARLPNKTMKYLFNTAVSANISLTASVNNQNITANVTSIVPRVTVTDTQVGNISGEHLTLIFKIVSNSFIIPKFNELGAEGLPLPGSKQFAFENPSFDLVENAIVFGTDLIWNPKLNMNLKTKAKTPNVNPSVKSVKPLGKIVNVAKDTAAKLGKGTAKIFNHPFKKIFG